jgi:hypothetical protein
MDRSVIAAFILICAAAATVGPITGQQVPTPQHRIVEVTIVATGKNNVPVEDLTVKEITVNDNGDKQQILSFTKHSNGGTATGKAGVHSIVLLDCIYTTFRDVPENRLEILKVVNELSRLNNVTFLLAQQELKTVDPSLLRKFASQRNQGFGLPNAKLDAYDWVFSKPLGLYQIFGAAEAVGRVKFIYSEAALEAIATNYLAESGRKSLLWISQGFPIPNTGRLADWDFTQQMLNDADVAVYPWTCSRRLVCAGSA